MSATEPSIMCVVNLILTEESGLSRLYVQKIEKCGWSALHCGYCPETSMTVRDGWFLCLEFFRDVLVTEVNYGGLKDIIFHC